MSDDSEALRELTLDLARSREQERRQRRTAEALVEGMKVLLSQQGRADVYRQLLGVLREPLGFDEAFVLVADGQDPTSLVSVAWTHDRWADLRMQVDRALERVIDGRPLAAFDVSRLASWSALAPERRQGVTSALHVAFRGEHDVAVLVCTHPERGTFHQGHLTLAEQLGLVGSLAVRQQEQLRQQLMEQRRLRQIVDSVPLILWSIDEDGVLLTATGRGLVLCGVDGDTLRGRPVRDVLGRGFADGARMALDGQHAVRTGELGGAVLETHFAPMPGGGAVAVSTDVTAQRRVEQVVRLNAELLEARDASEAANVAKSRFLANMSHELRTPLNAIIGYAEVLQEDLEGQDAVDDVHAIHRAGLHLLELINTVLDLARIEAGKMVLVHEDVVLDDVVEETSKQVRPLMEARGNTFSVENQGGRLVTDRLKVRQILLNLLSNAAKFTEEGTVSLRSGLCDGQAWFEVVDDGVGMTEAELARIWKPFEQADDSTTRRHGGSGLGLTLARSFAHMLGGGLSVTSTRGEGSCFRLTLPLTPP